MSVQELDVRTIPRPERHPQIFARFGALGPAESFVLINSHDPKHLRQEFETEQPGAFSWEYLERGPVWRVRIGRVNSAPAPQIAQPPS
jgi:uncharacterized protein (DUF2249 family)